MSLPTLRLEVECAMINPPMPIGIGVFEGDRMVGVVTLDQFKEVATRLEVLESAHHK